MITRKQMECLGLMLYYQTIIDTLLDFVQGEETRESEKRIKSAADLVVWLGAEFISELKETANGWRKSGENWPSYGYGDNKKPLYYEHYLIFKNVVMGGNYEDRLVEIKNSLLSLINPKIGFDIKKANAEACLNFFSNLLSACQAACRR